MAALRAKYPDRRTELSATVCKGQAVDHLKNLRQSLLSLVPGLSPGCGGLRPEFLVCLAEIWDKEEMELLENFGMMYLNGEMPAWFYKVWQSVLTVPLFKPDGGVRPVGVENPLLRTLHRAPVVQNKADITAALEPEQLSQSKAGGAKLVHSVRMLSEKRPDFESLNWILRMSTTR